LGLAQLLRKLKDLNVAGSFYKVKWVYEEGDEDWLEDGQNFQEVVDLQFEYESFVATPPQES
jgi:hypothetical protein